MTRRAKAFALSLQISGSLSLAHCSFDPPELSALGPVPVELAPPLEPPELIAMMRPDVRVGDPLQFAGRGFLARADGRVDVTFSGTFAPYGARPVDVSYTVGVDVKDPELVEARFGPFRVPFTRAGNQDGIFRGKVFATNRAFDGRARRQDEASWPTIELSVLPSIVVRTLAPRRDPTLELGPPDAVADLPYFAMIELVGFEAASIEYRLGSNVLIDGNAQEIVTHQAVGPVDVLGEVEVLTFASVPEGVDRYPTAIVIYAQSTNGETFTFDLPVTVHSGVPLHTSD